NHSSDKSEAANVSLKNDDEENQRPIYGIDYMIHPDVEAANAIVRAVENGAISDVISFGDSTLQIARITIMEGSILSGHKLMELRNLTKIKMLIAFFEENGVTSLPDGNTEMKVGCTLGILAEKDNLNDILELSGSKQKQLRKIMLFGAGKIGTLVASKIIEPQQTSIFKKLGQKVLRKNQDIVIIENDEQLATAAAERFPSARVFRADATDESFLINEGINDFDLAICASRNHELNMILSAFLESIGVKQTIGLVSSSSFSAIAQKLGIDVAIPLRDVIVDSIMSHLRGSAVKGIHTVNEGKLEIIECEISEGSKVAGKAIKDIAQPGKFLVLMTRPHNDEPYQIVNGNTVLEVGNHLVLIADSELSSKVLEIFGNQVE
nr:NAD-binding protein [Treponemataceae bacterium]